MNLSKSVSNWLSIDEPSDVVVSVRHTLRLLDFVGDERAVWKWVIIATHSALQGAMVCHLSGSAGLGCLSLKSASAWLEWHDKDGRGKINSIESEADEFGLIRRRAAKKADRSPRSYLAKPDDLFDRLYSENLRIEQGCGAVISISDSQKWSFRRLSELRNQFIHFTPKGWSIELSGLPRIVGDSFDVIELIARDNYPFRHLERKAREELGRLVTEVGLKIRALGHGNT